MSWTGSMRGFSRQMGRVGWQIEKKAIRQMTDEAAQIGLEAAEERTPVLTGALRSSLSIDGSIPPDKGYSRFGWSDEAAPMIVPGRRRSKSKRKGVWFGSTKAGRGNIAYRVRRVVDRRLGYVADRSVEKAL